MSKPHYGWWGYVKDMIRRYPEHANSDELAAVSAAIESTSQMINGSDRLVVIDLVLWKGTHKIPGAALMVPCSERTAQKWLSDFVKETAKNFSCNSLLS